jgi:hypothetical protein
MLPLNAMILSIVREINRAFRYAAGSHERSGVRFGFTIAEKDAIARHQAPPRRDRSAIPKASKDICHAN